MVRTCMMYDSLVSQKRTVVSMVTRQKGKLEFALGRELIAQNPPDERRANMHNGNYQQHSVGPLLSPGAFAAGGGCLTGCPACLCCGGNFEKKKNQCVNLQPILHNHLRFSDCGGRCTPPSFRLGSCLLPITNLSPLFIHPLIHPLTHPTQ